MRAPSQVTLESATVYTVRVRFPIAGRTYVPGEMIEGDMARAWPTFRSLLGLEWLMPATAPAPQYSARNKADAKPAVRRSKSRPKQA